MKRFVIALLLLTAGCTAVDHIPRESIYYGLDFSKYTAQGFLITPEKYQGEYESIGIVRYVIIPEARMKQVQVGTYSSGAAQIRKDWVIEKVQLSQGIDSLYTMAKNMGADAIVNFTSTVETRQHYNISKPVTLSGYDLAGYAIRRKK